MILPKQMMDENVCYFSCYFILIYNSTSTAQLSNLFTECLQLLDIKIL